MRQWTDGRRSACTKPLSSAVHLVPCKKRVGFEASITFARDLARGSLWKSRSFGPRQLSADEIGPCISGYYSLTSVLHASGHQRRLSTRNALPPELLRATIAHLFFVGSTAPSRHPAIDARNGTRHQHFRTQHIISPWTKSVLQETRQELKSPTQPHRDRPTQRHGATKQALHRVCHQQNPHRYSTLTFHIVDLLLCGKRPRNSEDIPRSSKPLHPSRQLKK